MPETRDPIETRVARGVALLDRTLADWDERIDLDRLNLCSSCNCILGQEFTSHPDVQVGDADPYDIGREALFGDDLDGDIAVRAHGFERHPGEMYAPLTAEWKRVILARRGGAS